MKDHPLARYTRVHDIDAHQIYTSVNVALKLTDLDGIATRLGCARPIWPPQLAQQLAAYGLSFMRIGCDLSTARKAVEAKKNPPPPPTITQAGKALTAAIRHSLHR